MFLSYGDGAILYSRWNHAADAHVVPVFHPWAVVLGMLLIFQCWRLRDKKPSKDGIDRKPSSEFLGIGKTRKVRR
jgi:hypothetical protein